MVRSREERQKELDNPFLNRISKADHAEDVRHNAAPKPFFPKKASDDRSERSKAFQKKWLG